MGLFYSGFLFKNTHINMYVVKQTFTTANEALYSCQEECL